MSSSTPPSTLRANIHFAEKDQALREDVHRLGELVGELVREQGGEALFDLVEATRRASIAHREGDARAAEELQKMLGALAPSAARELIRAFSTYFQMVNMAEQVHRIRRRRAYERDRATPQPHGFADTFERLKAVGVTAEEIESLMAQVKVEPVFLAHPTEVTRRTLLSKEQNIARYLIEMMDPYLTPQEMEATLGRIRLQMTAGWQTAEHPSEGVTLRDQAEHVLFFLTDVLYRTVPAFYESLERALVTTFSDGASRPRLPPILKFGTWVGGDMDGNPNVTAKSIRETLARQRSLVLDLYYDECLELARDLSQDVTRVGVSEELLARTAMYTGHFPHDAASIPVRHRQMPYRCFLRLVAARLKATRDDAAFPYESPEELIADIKLIGDSLRANKGRNAGLFGVQRLLRRAQTFGFHLATLDLRQSALVHRRVVGEALQEPNWAQLDAVQRTHRLAEALERRESPVGTLSSEARRTLAVFQTIAHCRRKYGPDAIGPYIVSMAHGPDDVLAVLLLAKWGHLGPKGSAVPLDIAPLFETVEDLEHAPQVMDRLIADPQYREHLRSRGDHQVVMLGFSDSHRDGGVAAARWSLQKAQHALVETMSRHGLKLTIFHGRGGTIGRTGGSLHEAVLAAPEGAIAGRLRLIEQGETINAKYGLRGIAIRTLEQMVATVLAVTARPPAAPDAAVHWHAVMDDIAHGSRAAVERLVGDPADFEEYFRAATPIDVIERIRVGTESGGEDDGYVADPPAALPWFFAWTQNRCLLPGWFGMASGLSVALERHGEQTLREMLERWPFFRVLVSDVAIELAKADLSIGERYSRLAGERHERYFPAIRAEYERCVELILRLTGRSELIDPSRTLWRAIRLRNPYVDPISFLQVDLLARWRRAGRPNDATLQALMASVNGIAHGMQTAG